jgi:phosphohistidine phosphatase
MELVILRHGTAEDSNPGGDSARNLVEKGRQQSRDAGLLLKSAGLLPEIVLTSPFARARQTAEEFCAAAGIPAPVAHGWLASGMDAQTALNELVDFREFSRVAIVGHEPDLSELVQWILGAHGNSIEMRKGAVACLRIFPPAKSGTLLYLAPPVIAGNC